MSGWWIVVFWLLLIPLIVIELIVYLKSKKFYWLTYALSIFTYVIAVSYTIDAFSLGKNSVILILLASAILMFAMGKQMSKKITKQKKTSNKKLGVAILILSIMIVVFAVSAIFGRLNVTIEPVQSIKSSDVMIWPASDKPYVDTSKSIVIMNSELKNDFLLPVPIKHDENYKVCLVTDHETYELSQSYNGKNPEEVPAFSSLKLTYNVMPYYNYDKTQAIIPQKVLVYKTTADNQWQPCDEQTDLYATIPVA